MDGEFFPEESHRSEVAKSNEKRAHKPPPIPLRPVVPPDVPFATQPIPSSPPPAHPPKNTSRTRIFATSFLVLVVAGLGSCAVSAYRAARDSYVAPVILSPSSEIVIANRLRTGEYIVERARAAAELEGAQAAVQAANAAVEKLGSLRHTIENARQWSAELSQRQADTASEDIQSLGSERRVLVEMAERQEILVGRARSDLASGLVSRGDLAKEIQALDQLRLSILENTRTTMRSRAVRRESLRILDSLNGVGGVARTPEAIEREEQLVRIEMEMLRLQAEARGKSAQIRALGDRISQIDRLAAELRDRPFVQAAQRTVDLAFVPYTQLDGVTSGAGVYDCVWGLFACERVGRVTRVVGGEVVLPDPWGSPTRGQYVVMHLWNREGARSNVLRVRPPSGNASGDQAAAQAARTSVR